MSINLQKLIAEQVEACKQWLMVSPPLRSQPQMTLEKFVERSVMMHRNLINLWGGFTFKGGEGVYQNLELQQQAIDRCIRALATKMQTLHIECEVDFSNQQAERRKDRTKPPYSRSEHDSKRTIPLQMNPTFDLYSKDGPDDYQLLAYNNLLLHKTIPESPDVVRRLGNRWPSEMSLHLGVLNHYSPTGLLNTTVIKRVIRPGQRVTSVALAALKDKGIDERYPLVYKMYEQFFQEIGEKVWASVGTSFFGTLDCSPLAFLKLGHYGERNSCYRNGGEKDSSKLFLACDVPDSLVAVFYSKDAPDTPVARCWGVAKPGAGAAFSNFYLLNSDTVAPILHELCKKGLKIRQMEAKKQGYDTNSSDEYMLTMVHAHGSMYCNRDGMVFQHTTPSRRRFIHRYWSHIATYCDTTGKYARNGAGPAWDTAINGDRSLLTRGAPIMWPYEDYLPHTMHEGGFFKV